MFLGVTQPCLRQKPVLSECEKNMFLLCSRGADVVVPWKYVNGYRGFTIEAYILVLSVYIVSTVCETSDSLNFVSCLICDDSDHAMLCVCTNYAHLQVQRRTIAWIAATYALHFTGQMMVGMNKDMEADIATAGRGAMIGAVHAIGSCLKAVTTTISCDGIEELRRTCGGYGYSSFSGLDTILGQALLQYTGSVRLLRKVLLFDCIQNLGASVLLSVRQ